MKKFKREVSYDGSTYKVRSDTIEIPDFTQMGRTEVLLWMCRHTYDVDTASLTRFKALVGQSVYKFKEKDEEFMKLTSSMLKTLKNLQRGKTTAFGYTVDTNGPTYINGNSVKALIRRGLLEPCGQMPWQTYMDDNNQQKGHFVSTYQISATGREALDLQVGSIT